MQQRDNYALTFPITKMPDRSAFFAPQQDMSQSVSQSVTRGITITDTQKSNGYIFTLPDENFSFPTKNKKVLQKDAPIRSLSQ
jgi:hypothetical protein